MIMSTAGTNDRVPELDLRRLDAGEAARVVFLEELRAAAHGVGFFYIAGHGVESALLRDLMQTTRRFFALPEADKLAIEMISSPHFRGYVLEPLYGDDPHYLIKLIHYPGHDVSARHTSPRARTRSAKPIVPRGWTELHEGAAAVPSRCGPASSRRSVEIRKIPIESARNASKSR